LQVYTKIHSCFLRFSKIMSNDRRERAKHGSQIFSGGNRKENGATQNSSYAICETTNTGAKSKAASIDFRLFLRTRQRRKKAKKNKHQLQMQSVDSVHKKSLNRNLVGNLSHTIPMNRRRRKASSKLVLNMMDGKKKNDGSSEPSNILN